MNTLYLKRTIANKCPRCGEGKVLDGVFVRRDTCPVCGLKYDRGEDGFFLGGVPVSYSLICTFWILPIITLWFFDIFSLEWMLGLCLGGALILPIISYRYCQLLWLGLYYCFAKNDMPKKEHSAGRIAND